MNKQVALVNYFIRLGDNNLVLGQRLAEWCSNGPILEEDLAMTNISLDHFGQAEFMYETAAELEGKSRTADDIAFRRSERHYFNNLITEIPNGDFAFTMVRQMLYSAFAKFLYESLSESKHETLASLSARALKEVKYHYRHSSEWVIRLGQGTAESKRRTQFALNEIWTFTGNLFEMNETDHVLIAEGISFDLNSIYPKWVFTVNEIIKNAGLEIPQQTYMQKGGIDGMHTEHLGHLLCELQYLQRAYPDAKW